MWKTELCFYPFYRAQAPLTVCLKHLTRPVHTLLHLQLSVLLFLVAVRYPRNRTLATTTWMVLSSLQVQLGFHIILSSLKLPLTQLGLVLLYAQRKCIQVLFRMPGRIWMRNWVFPEFSTLSSVCLPPSIHPDYILDYQLLHMLGNIHWAHYQSPPLIHLWID